MITAASLKSYTAKDLGQMAKRRGVTGWHAMKKDELVKALVKAAKASATKSGSRSGKGASNKKQNGSASNGARKSGTKASASRNGSSAASNGASAARNRASAPSGGSAAAKSRAASAKAQNGKAQNGKVQNGKAPTSKSSPAKASSPKGSAAKASRSKSAAAKPTSPKVVENIRSIQQQREMLKDMAVDSASVADGQDRILLLVRDSYWIHAYWEISRRSVDRAKAALAENWHTAKPVLRVMELDGDGSNNAAERMVRQIEIHGGVKNWYIDVPDPPKSYRCHLGYLASNGRFHALVRSNVVTTPRPGACEEVDGNWDDVAENVEKIYALSSGSHEDHASQEIRELLEERFHRPVGVPMAARLGTVGDQFGPPQANTFDLDIEVEMIIYGSTRSEAYVTLAGEPVKVREDGTFIVKMDLPDKRQIFPIVARTKDGLEQRTVALAVERNTKVMDPVSRDSASL